VLDFTIKSSVEQALEASKRVIDFCRENELDEMLATRLGVSTEELCVNTAKYAGKSGSGNIDVYLKIGDKSVILKLRDDGDIFNPTEYADDSGKIITGLQMVRAVSSDIEYSRVIGFNVTVVTVERQKV
ncbi:MAG: ATP-binding protein, partial [Eubacterium sp.]|nr:ATP-binding protein [Eubacterium sp.]